MSNLQQDLQTAAESLTVQWGTGITEQDIPSITNKICERMKRIGGWALDSVRVNLFDDTERLQIIAVSGRAEAEITLGFEGESGQWARIDTDGDGQ